MTTNPIPGAADAARGGKARGVIFSGPMILALLEGRKTQTRRVVKPQPKITQSRRAQERRCWHTEVEWKGNLDRYHGFSGLDDGGAQQLQSWAEDHCPYGKPGDKLWVREAWLYVGPDSGGGNPDYERAAMRDQKNRTLENIWYKATRTTTYQLRWRTPLHMPRWASRITLTLTDVRCQRVQDISEEDAIAEGVSPIPYFLAGEQDFHPGRLFQERFRVLWESVHGPGAWERNDWVWALSFSVEVGKASEVTT